jgi:adenine-specific DNA-methyltransferase
VRNYIQDDKLKAIKLNSKKDYRINPIDLKKFIIDKYVHKDKSKEENFKKNTDILVNNISSNTKNCGLIYDNKMKKNEIKKSIKDIELEYVEKNHDNGLIDSIYKGDNIYILKRLLNDYKGKIDLVYIDPPFGTNNEFIAYDGVTGYSDKITNEEFLEFLRKRLYLIHELLSDNGSLYLHIDKKMSHYVKLILDEVFGEKNYINEITRIKCNPKNFSRNAFGNYTDTIFLYAKYKDKNIWNNVRFPLTKDEIKRLFRKKDSKNRRYTTHPLHAPGITEDGPTGDKWKGMDPPKGRHWRYPPSVLDELEADGLIEWSSNGNPRKIVYAKDHKGKKPQDLWKFKDKGKKYTTYPTEKNNEMLEFIIKNSSNKDSIVLDCFAGSFSTLIQAKKLNRKFIGIDFDKTSLKVGKENLNKENIKYNYYKIKEGL